MLSQKVSAILAAGGQGLRFSANGNESAAVSTAKQSKQFIQLQGRPLYVWSLLTLCNEARIDRIVIVVPEAMVTTIKEEIAQLNAKNKFDKEILVVKGGKSRQESVHLGLLSLSSCVPAPQFALIHDACRPLLNDATLSGVIDQVLKTGACTVAVPVYDTVKRIDHGQIVETLDRKTLNLVQTPQAARFDWLLQAHQNAKQKGIEVTDDAAILEEEGHKISVVTGSPYNVKVTNKEDLFVCEALLPIFFKRSF